MKTTCEHPAIVSGCETCAARSPYAHAGKITIGERDYTLPAETLAEGSKLWPCAIALARFLDGFGFRGRSVCELGCGLGLPSLVAAVRGGRVVRIEKSPDVVARATGDSETMTRVADLRSDWTTLTGQFDWVIASEVLFRPYDPASLAVAIDRLWNRRGACWIANQAGEYAIDPRPSLAANNLTGKPWSQYSVLPDGRRIAWTLWEVC